MKLFLKNKYGFFLLLMLVLGINWLASIFHKRLDLTNENRFTLSNSTKKLLKQIDAPITINVFLKGDYPSGFKQLASSANDILKEFKEIAGNKINFSFINASTEIPNTTTKYEDTLSALGLYPINLTSQIKEGQQQQFVYPYAMLSYNGANSFVELYKGKTPLINFNDLSSAEALLEYNFANAISKITQKEKPVVGYALGNGEPLDGRVYDLMTNVLQKDYKFFTLDISGTKFIPQEFKTLLIVKPSIGFTEYQKLKLDQFVMGGGKLLIFMDRLNAEMDSLQLKNEVTAFDRNLELNELFFNYGARVNADLVLDLNCDYLPFDVNGNGQFELLPWNYFPVMESKNNHPINKGVGFVAGNFVNSIDTVEATGIKKTILLSSSANARTLGSPAIISGRENVTAPEDDKYKKSNIPTAVLLEGKFNSLFTNRLSTSFNDSLNSYNLGFLPQCINNNKIIIVSDGDVVLNSLVKSNPIPMGMNRFTYGSQKEFPFANKIFLQNCLDYLVNENGLSEAKAKDYTPKLLDTKKVNEQKNLWQLLNIALPIFIVILFAIIFNWLRKRKYALKNG
jgi:ABC-2 type transport system permease protein